MLYSISNSTGYTMKIVNIVTLLKKILTHTVLNVNKS